MKDLIKRLVEAYGPSGAEDEVRALIESELADAMDDVRVDAMGNLIAHKQGSGGKRIMVAAHMDEIGLIVTHVDENGYLRFARVGGILPGTPVGSRVRFRSGAGADAAMGVIGHEDGMEAKADGTWDKLFVDVGATSKADSPVQVGDVGGFVQPMADLGNRLVAKSMDDRVGCAVVIAAAKALSDTPNDLYLVFTTQEEVGTRGAVVSAFGVEPDVAIAVDVTPTGDYPEAKPKSVSLGKGAAIKVLDSGMISHRGVKDWMVATAEERDITYQLEVLDRGTTDARAIQTSRAGVPAGCLSIPTRYVHTQSEMVDMDDVDACVALMTALLESVPTL